MALNPSIILAGQQVQPVNALAQGAAAGQQVRDFQHNNALRAMMQQHGAGAIQGDQNALNALAAFDPRAAQAIQSGRLNQEATRLNMDRTRQQMAALDADQRRAVEAHAAAMSTAELNAQTERLEGILSGAAHFHSTGDQAGYNTYLQQNGLDPANPEYAFQNFPATAARYGEVLDTLKQFQTMNAAPEQPTPFSSIGKLQADLAAGRITQDQYELAVQNMTPSGMSLQVGEDGSISLEQGPGAGSPTVRTPSERQSTLALFGGLMTETMPEIAALEADPDFNPAGLREGLAARGGILGNYAQSPKGQRYEALKRQWAEGVLRIQTGAAATQEEINRVMETYFPMPGDTPETVEQKAIQRDIFARSLGPASGGTIEAPGGAYDRPGLGEPPPTVDFSSMDQDALGAFDLSTATLDQINAWNARMDALEGR